jgi:hypothetical protein
MSLRKIRNFYGSDPFVKCKPACQHTKFWLESPKGRDRFEEIWEFYVKMNKREIGLEGVDWIDLLQDRVQ